MTNPAMKKLLLFVFTLWAVHAQAACQGDADGARPLFEADLMQQVSSARISQAQTMEDVKTSAWTATACPMTWMWG
jgi:hypothetical protein